MKLEAPTPVPHWIESGNLRGKRLFEESEVDTSRRLDVW